MDAERILDEAMMRFASDTRPRMFGEDALWHYKRGASMAALGRADAGAELQRAIAVEGRKWVHGRAISSSSASAQIKPSNLAPMWTP